MPNGVASTQPDQPEALGVPATTAADPVVKNLSAEAPAVEPAAPANGVAEEMDWQEETHF